VHAVIVGMRCAYPNLRLLRLLEQGRNGV